MNRPRAAVRIRPAHSQSKLSVEEWSARRAGDAEYGGYLGSIDAVADLVSLAFLASPVFSEVEPARYQREPIVSALQQGYPLVAWYGYEIIGTATLFPPNPESACPAFRDIPTLGLLAVDPEYAGRGVGTALMIEIEAEATRQGYGQIGLSVTQRGKELIAFYERRGYRFVDTMQWPSAVGPSTIMVREL